jgi:hypothetical protein
MLSMDACGKADIPQDGPPARPADSKIRKIGVVSAPLAAFWQEMQDFAGIVSMCKRGGPAARGKPERLARF